MVKKFFLFLITGLLFVSCTSMVISTANNQANKNNYTAAIKSLENQFKNDMKSEKLAKTFNDIYIRGYYYYNNLKADKELFLIENSYINIPLEIKNKLQNIEFDEKVHIERGKKVAKEILKQADLIGTDSYIKKVRKYKLYNYVLKFDPSIKNKVDLKLLNLMKSMEKSYNIKMLGNTYLSSDFKNYLYNNLNRNYFQITDWEADMTLYVRLENFSYVPAHTNTENIFKVHKSEKKNDDGETVIVIMNYFMNKHTKETRLDFDVSYKLVSNKTNEILFSNRKHMSDKHRVSWKTYNSSAYWMNLPKDQKEKRVPTKEEMLNKNLEEISKLINNNFDRLEKIN